MPRMTEEEADALDELVTKHPPRVDPSKARHVARMVALDDFSAEYLLSVSTATHKTPVEIINEMVRAKATDEEANYWDEYFTANPPELGQNGTDFLSLREARLLGVDDLSVNYLKTRAEATHQSFGQVINALVREKVAATL